MTHEKENAKKRIEQRFDDAGGDVTTSTFEVGVSTRSQHDSRHQNSFANMLANGITKRTSVQHLRPSSCRYTYGTMANDKNGFA